MKPPIIKYDDRFLDSVSWFFKVGGITLWPFIILREIYNSTPPWRRKAARIIGVSEAIINHSENGRRDITPDYILKVVTSLGYSYQGHQAFFHIFQIVSD